MKESQKWFLSRLFLIYLRLENRFPLSTESYSRLHQTAKSRHIHSIIAQITFSFRINNSTFYAHNFHIRTMFLPQFFYEKRFFERFSLSKLRKVLAKLIYTENWNEHSITNLIFRLIHFKFVRYRWFSWNQFFSWCLKEVKHFYFDYHRLWRKNNFPLFFFYSSITELLKYVTS